MEVDFQSEGRVRRFYQDNAGHRRNNNNIFDDDDDARDYVIYKNISKNDRRENKGGCLVLLFFCLLPISLVKLCLW